MTNQDANSTGILNIPVELRHLITEEVVRILSTEQGHASRSSCCFTDHHVHFYRNGLAHLANIGGFQKATEIAWRASSRIPVLLLKPDGARYRPASGIRVLGAATPGRDGCSFWYGRTSTDRQGDGGVLYNLAGCPEFLVEVEKACDGRELVGDNEGIILHYIVHSVKRAIREALYNIDTMHKAQTLKCIFHVKKTPLYHIALLRKAHTERSATFKELMDLIWSRIRYRQSFSSTPRFRHPYSALKHVYLEFWYPGDICMVIKYEARSQQDPTLPPWELVSSSSSATTTYLCKEFIKTEMRRLCEPLCFAPLLASIMLYMLPNFLKYVNGSVSSGIELPSLYGANGRISARGYLFFCQSKVGPWMIVFPPFVFAILPELMIGSQLLLGWNGVSGCTLLVQNGQPQVGQMMPPTQQFLTLHYRLMIALLLTAVAIEAVHVTAILVIAPVLAVKVAAWVWSALDPVGCLTRCWKWP